MEDLAVITALNQSGSFGENFVKLKKYICVCVCVTYRLRVGLYRKKTVNSVLKMLPSAYCDLGHRFSPYGPPSRQITYIYANLFLSVSM